MMLCLCFVNTDCVYADTYSYRACHGIFKYYGKVDATCTTVGHKAYWQCFTCGRLYLDDLGRPGKRIASEYETVTSATGHSYGEPTFIWENDYSKSTASFVCKNNSSHVETKECTVSSSTTPATCLEEGKITYTANCKLDGKNYQDTQEVVISATGHTWKDGKCTVCGEKQPVTEEKKQETKQEVKQAGTAIKATTTTAGPKSKTDTDTSSPKTGDNQEMPYIWMILLLSLGGVTGAILKRKKEK